jgi:hypothetical protein
MTLAVISFRTLLSSGWRSVSSLSEVKISVRILRIYLFCTTPRLSPGLIHSPSDVSTRSGSTSLHPENGKGLFHD